MSPNELQSLIARVMHEPAEQILQIVSANRLTRSARQQAAWAVLELAATASKGRHWGRVRTHLLVAFAFMPKSESVWRQAVRLQVLSIGEIDSTSKCKIWDQLASENEGALGGLHPRLAQRVRTLKSLEGLRIDIQVRCRIYRRLLDRRPLGLLKSALAYADNAFSPRDDDPLEAGARVLKNKDLTLYLEAREELAESISTLVAEAMERSSLSPLEASMPAAEHIEGESLPTLVMLAALRWKFRYVCKHVDALDYEVCETKHQDTTSLVLTPPSPDHELWLRQGYVEARLEALAAPLQLDAPHPLVRIRDVYTDLLARMNEKGQAALVLKTSPYRRYVVQVPWNIVSTRLLEFSFYEDFHDAHMNGLELQIEESAFESLELAPNLCGADFMTLFRGLRYFALLHIHIVADINEDDAEAIYNSSLPLISRKELVRMLGYTGIASTSIEAFIDLLSAPKSGSGYIDLQYTPLVRDRGNLMLLPGLIVTSAALRNTLASARKRVSTAGEAFSAAIADLLREVFGTAITTSRRVRSNHLGETDVDVASFIDETLYLWECKHSLPPTSPHEARDVWRDIERATEQLLLAQTILSADPGLHNRLQSWFTTVPPEQIRVKRVVLVVMTSTRMWSGMSVAGIPVRDVHSLQRMLRGDRFGVPTRGEQEWEFERFGLPVSQPLGRAELDDYLAPIGRYWSLRRSWNAPATLLLARVGKTTLAHTTTIAGPYDYDGLVPDALANGYQSLGRHIRRPKIRGVGSAGDEEPPAAD